MDAQHEENTPAQINGEKLSFGIRTVVSVIIQVIFAVFFFARLDSKINRLDEIVGDVRTDAADRRRNQAKTDADIATINIRLAIIENQLHLQQQIQKP